MYLENLRHVIHSRPIGCNKSFSLKYFVTYQIKSSTRDRYTRNKTEEIETKDIERNLLSSRDAPSGTITKRKKQ